MADDTRLISGKPPYDELDRMYRDACKMLAEQRKTIERLQSELSALSHLTAAEVAEKLKEYSALLAEVLNRLETVGGAESATVMIKAFTSGDKDWRHRG